jgi:xanthine dehydrogenase YagS FAD-binding subunit
MYRKARDRASYAFAVGAVAVALDVQDGHVVDVRLALGAVAPRPWRAYATEEALRGGPASPDAFRAAVRAELAAADALPDNAFKVRLATNLSVATLTTLSEHQAEEAK